MVKVLVAVFFSIMLCKDCYEDASTPLMSLLPVGIKSLVPTQWPTNDDAGRNQGTSPDC